MALLAGLLTHTDTCLIAANAESELDRFNYEAKTDGLTYSPTNRVSIVEWFWTIRVAKDTSGQTRDLAFAVAAFPKISAVLFSMLNDIILTLTAD